jgi:hypothetical protein
MADFFGKSRQVNGTFARSAQAEALKKRFLSSNVRREIDNKINIEYSVMKQLFAVTATI